MTTPVPTTTVEDTLQNCIRMIERKDIVAGVGSKIAAPLISVILGEEAEAHLSTIEATYGSYWASAAQHLVYQIGPYTCKQLEDSCIDAMMNTTKMDALERDRIRIAWYWDIMDPKFEEYFELVRQPLDLPCPAGRNFFIFCRQLRSEERAVTQERLERLLQWAKDSDNHLVVLSNHSPGGTLRPDEISQNYHLAATIQFLMNAASAPETVEARMARNLEFRLHSSVLWSAGYNNCPRKYRDIINVSLLKIIERIYEKGTEGMDAASVSEPQKGSGFDYIKLLGSLFNQVLEPLCPGEEDRRFWEDLPRTVHMEQLERVLAGEQPQTGPFWKKLFTPRAEGSWEQAIESVQDIWDGCVRMYYLEPISSFLRSSQGRAAMDTYITKHMTGILSLNELSKLSTDAQILRSDERYVNIQPRQPNPQQPKYGRSLAAYLHEYACYQVKCELCREMVLNMAESVERLSKKARGFEPLMRTVRDSFRGVNINPSIRDAYGSHMKRLLDNNEELVANIVGPCADEAELLHMMESLFRELVEKDKEHRYFATLQEDIQFQIENGNPAATTNVVTDCFGKELRNLGRLRSYEQESGFLYCIMNDTMTAMLNGISNENVGERFVVNRSDRIERLYLYPIPADKVHYSNR